MTLDIVIPSYHRQLKLLNCIKSITEAIKDYNINLYVYFSDLNDFNNFDKIPRAYWIIPKIIDNYRVPLFWNTHLKQMTSDAMIYLTDDVLLYENFFDVIHKEYTDLDSIMGICQANLTREQALDSAFGIIGKEYLNRFPDKNPWCPSYYRFYADRELGDFAKSINKFKFCDKAKLIHLHPSVEHSQMDETHHLVRKYLKQDKTTYNLRKSLNYLWGRDFFTT